MSNKTQTTDTNQQKHTETPKERPATFRFKEEAPNNTFPVEIAFRCSDEDMHRAFKLAMARMAISEK